jgi:hypothetical protein|tara:strand:+ start:353 stop:706 length:354 start_codon:yes stop_codon:yes gene_type:complete
MTYSNLDQTFNIETMQLEAPEETAATPLFVRLTKQQQKQVVKCCPSRPGRGFSYPWKDPSYSVGDSFFKPVSPGDWEKNRGRPNVPPKNTMGGRGWKTTKAYREDTKQHGYYVERVA